MSKVSIGIADTVVGAGTVTTPGAGAVIASTAVLSKGSYDVEVTIVLTGTAETQLENLRLQDNTGNTTIIDTPFPSLSASAGPVKIHLPRVTVDGTVGLSVAAIALATTGAVYTVVITATRVE